MDKPTKEIESSEYGDCISVDEYKGKISIVAARKSKQGEIYPSWSYPQRVVFDDNDDSYDRMPGDKAVPHKVLIGTSKDEAISNLRWAIEMLGGEPITGPDEDIPF